uniref:Uncharacterized protein n=1 Tax=Arundo donax TaxID=35708 RepID=A0A0A8YNC8_ARUDO
MYITSHGCPNSQRPHEEIILIQY